MTKVCGDASVDSDPSELAVPVVITVKLRGSSTLPGATQPSREEHPPETCGFASPSRNGFAIVTSPEFSVVSWQRRVKHIVKAISQVGVFFMSGCDMVPGKLT